MTLDDNAVLTVGAGNYLIAPTGTPKPVDLTEPATPWNNAGHTSIEDILSISSEGGEKTVLATLQNSSLRTKYSKRTDTLAFTLQQFDTPSLLLYYGSNSIILEDGDVGVPDDPRPTVCAFLAVFLDGENVFGLYMPKAEIYRADDLSISDTESIAGLPLGVTPMKFQANKWTYAITPLGTV